MWPTHFFFCILWDRPKQVLSSLEDVAEIVRRFTSGCALVHTGRFLGDARVHLEGIDADGVDRHLAAGRFHLVAAGYRARLDTHRRLCRSRLVRQSDVPETGHQADGMGYINPSIPLLLLSYLLNGYWKIENHRTESQFERNRVTKLLLFEFVNNFMSLFYIAFYLRDIRLLQWVSIILL